MPPAPRKYPDALVAEVRRLWSCSVSAAETARRLGLTRAQVRAILDRVRHQMRRERAA